MSKQGQMKAIDGYKQGEVFGGKFTVPRLINTNIRFETVPKRMESSPDYEVQVPCYDEAADETYWGTVGAGWNKEKGDLKYISFNLDLHDGSGMIYAAAFGSEDDQPEGWKDGDPYVVYNFNYKTPRARPSGANTSPSTKGKLKDSIAF